MTRPIVREDIEKFLFLAQPSLSPDGSRVAYVVSRTDRENNCYASNLWLYSFEEGESRQLTGCNKVKFYTWSFCGDSLYFASTREKKKEEHPIADTPQHTDFFRLPVDGGEAVKVFTLDYACSSIEALGGMRFLVIASKPLPKENPEGANYYKTNELPFSANGAGYLQPARNVVLLHDRNDGSTVQLTDDLFDVQSLTVSADKKRALIIGQTIEHARGKYNHVYLLDLETRKLEHLSEGLVFNFDEAGWRGDEIIVLGSDLKKTGVNENARFFKLENARLKELAPTMDTSCHSSVGCDLRYGNRGGAAFLELDGSLIFNTTHGFKSNLFALQADGLIRQVTELTAVDSFDVKDGLVALVGHQGLSTGELYVLRGGELTKLTDHNGPLLAELNLSVPEYHSFDNGEGLMLDGWILRPTNYEEGRKYPSILHIHGGPKTVFGETLFHEMQCWAAEGYIVYYCNPRGGDGRPDGFDDIRGHYGDWDYKDLMAFTDYVLSVEPGIDREKMGVTGGSYGGYMTNWIVGQTDRFAAACAQRPISNWVSKFGSSDIGYFFVPDQHGGGDLWTNLDQWWADSPLKYAQNVKTPLLLIQSIDDFRCELTQSTQMFTALKTRGVECEMCLFVGENHELSRSGKPKERLARLREITTWFNKHLKD